MSHKLWLALMLAASLIFINVGCSEQTHVTSPGNDENSGAQLPDRDLQYIVNVYPWYDGFPVPLDYTPEKPYDMNTGSNFPLDGTSMCTIGTTAESSLVGIVYTTRDDPKQVRFKLGMVTYSGEYPISFSPSTGDVLLYQAPGPMYGYTPEVGGAVIAVSRTNPNRLFVTFVGQTIVKDCNETYCCINNIWFMYSLNGGGTWSVPILAQRGTLPDGTFLPQLSGPNLTIIDRPANQLAPERVAIAYTTLGDSNVCGAPYSKYRVYLKACSWNGSTYVFGPSAKLEESAWATETTGPLTVGTGRMCVPGISAYATGPGATAYVFVTFQRWMEPGDYSDADRRAFIVPCRVVGSPPIITVAANGGQPIGDEDFEMDYPKVDAMFHPALNQAGLYVTAIGTNPDGHRRVWFEFGTYNAAACDFNWSAAGPIWLEHPYESAINDQTCAYMPQVACENLNTQVPPPDVEPAVMIGWFDTGVLSATSFGPNLYSLIPKGAYKDGNFALIDYGRGSFQNPPAWWDSPPDPAWPDVFEGGYGNLPEITPVFRPTSPARTRFISLFLLHDSDTGNGGSTQYYFENCVWDG